MNCAYTTVPNTLWDRCDKYQPTHLTSPLLYAVFSSHYYFWSRACVVYVYVYKVQKEIGKLNFKFDIDLIKWVIPENLKDKWKKKIGFYETLRYWGNSIKTKTFSRFFFQIHELAFLIVFLFFFPFAIEI